MTEEFNTTYDLHSDAIERYCHWKSRSLETGQDLMQETFLRYWTYVERGEVVPNIRALLYRIAHNLFIDHVRKKRESSLDQMLETGFEPSENLWHHTESKLDAEKWIAKLQTLPVSHRTVLHQRFILGLPPAEIATMNGESSNVVSVRIFRGLKQLRREIPEHRVISSLHSAEDSISHNC